MKADQDTIEESRDEIDIAEAAEQLKGSLEEMSTLTGKLSGTMADLADGFESFGESTSELHDKESARIDPAAGSTPAAADD